MKQVGGAVTSFQEMLLEGVASPELMQHGLTLEEERAASGTPQVTIQNILLWPTLLDFSSTLYSPRILTAALVLHA